MFTVFRGFFSGVSTQWLSTAAELLLSNCMYTHTHTHLHTGRTYTHAHTNSLTHRHTHIHTFTHIHRITHATTAARWERCTLRSHAELDLFIYHGASARPAQTHACRRAGLSLAPTPLSLWLSASVCAKLGCPNYDLCLQFVGRDFYWFKMYRV